MAHITRILFVCTGNTCRSPLAEGLCRTMAAQAGLEVEVRSAGVAAMDGSSVSLHTQDILAARNASAGLTPSESVTEEKVRWADLILTMTMGHKRTVLRQFPEAGDKVYALKEYAIQEAQVGGGAQAGESDLADLAGLHLKQALGQPLTGEERRRLQQGVSAPASYDISDPYGGSRWDYERAAADIEDALERVIARLKAERGQ